MPNDAIKDQFESDETLKGIANNPHTPGYLLEKIACTKWLQSEPGPYGIKARTYHTIAQHLSTPPIALEYLAEIPFLMSTVAANPNLPTQVLQKLSNSDDSWVRYEVARN